MWLAGATAAGSVALAEALWRVVPDRRRRLSLNLGCPKNIASFKVKGSVNACGSESTLIECEALDQGTEGGFTDLLLPPAEWSSSRYFHAN